jgi:calcium-dependent protein kinase
MKIYEFYQDYNNFYIVSELCEGGALFQYLLKNERLKESECALLMRQLFSVITYCHKEKVIHRDLKPANLILKRKNDLSSLKVIDFGCSIK